MEINHNPSFYQISNNLSEARDRLKTFRQLKRKAFLDTLKYLIIFVFKFRKLKIFKGLLTLFVIATLCYVSYSFMIIKQKVKIETIYRENIIYKEDSTKTFDRFLLEVKLRESGNNPSIVNQYGYMGYYQFGRSALETVGLGSISNEQFLNNPELQDIAFKMLLKHNKNKMSSYIGKYQSKKIKGVYITESGLLMACHLVGCSPVITYLESNGNIIAKDGNNIPLTHYLEKFQGYKIILE